MRIGYTESDSTVVTRYLAEHHLIPGKFAAIAPMTTWPSRCWPLERYAEVAENLQADGLPVVLIGSSGEREGIEAVASRMKKRPLIAAGQFTFRQLAAFLDFAGLVVSGDTGPMHLAAAVETPYLALFGSTSRERFAPLVGKGAALIHPVPCAPCYQKHCPRDDEKLICLKGILTAEAIESARKVAESRA